MMRIGPTLDRPDDDPFLDLEDINGVRALSWVEAQNARTRAQFSDAQHEADTSALLNIMDRPDRIPYVRRRGAWLYNFWKDEKSPRGIIRRTTMASYRTAAPEWEVELDIDELAEAENEDWVYAGGITMPRWHDRVIFKFSRGGSDATVLREFDRTTRSFVTEGFVLEEAKTDGAFFDRDTLILGSAYGGPEFETDAGYSRTVRVWRRGERPEDARIIYEGDRKHSWVGASVDHSDPGKPQMFISDGVDFFNTVNYLSDLDGKARKIDVPSDCWLASHKDILGLKPRTTQVRDGVTYEADTLMVCSLRDFMAGERKFATLFKPAQRQALQYFDFVDDKVLVHFKDNLKPRFQLWAHGSGGWVEAPLPALPDAGEVDLGNLDSETEEANGDLVLSVNDPVTPPSVYFVAKNASQPELLKSAPASFDATGVHVTHHEAIATDGERIPYVQVGPEDSSGRAPVYMTGYGGFGMAQDAHYSGRLGKLWLERGGTVVYANIRGGGEFGTPWHDAGRRDKKAVSHDDFATIASDLVKRRVTVPKRIAAEGGSNGGLLISNMLVRYPERFGALFCTIPLIDMRRYSKLLAGASWIAEYGDPDDPKEWSFIQHFSPYHLAEPGKAYPPILISTTKADDRVHPGHARKFAAKLQAMGYPASYHELQTGGHGYGKNNKEVADFAALGLRFLRQMIGFE
jgi:prolyl oligopeptidase